MAAAFTFAQRYYSLPVAHILAENPGNWALDYAQVEKVKVKTGSAGDEESRASSDEIVLKTSSGRYVFDIGANGAGDARRAFAAVGLL